MQPDLSLRSISPDLAEILETASGPAGIEAFTDEWLINAVMRDDPTLTREQAMAEIRRPRSKRQKAGSDMSDLELAALGVTIATTAFATLQTWRLSCLIRVARRVTDAAMESRNALRFVAEGHSRPFDPQFAGALIDGNDLVLRQRFPKWSAFRDHERERDIDMEFEAYD